MYHQQTTVDRYQYKTGAVDLLASAKSDLLMVRSETPIEIWNHLPQETRVYLTGQLDALMKTAKDVIY